MKNIKDKRKIYQIILVTVSLIVSIILVYFLLIREDTRVIETKEKPIKLSKQMNLMITISDEKIIELLINLKNENKKVVNDYKNDPEKISKFIIGYVMKNTQGKANSLKVQELISKIFCD